MGRLTLSTLRDRVVLITGASSGIGAATAIACGAEGMRLALAGRRPELLAQVAQQVRSAGGEALVCPTDVGDPQQVDALVAATVAAFGRVDILVANAGVGYSGSMAQMPEEQIVTMVQVNLLGVLRCVRAVLPVMLAQGRGHVVTVSSVAAGIAGPDAAVYAATKAAVHRFSEGLRRELQPRGLFVTDVLPGFIDTPMTASVRGVPKAPPATVARAILDAIRRPRRSVVTPSWYRLILSLNGAFPALLDRLIAGRQRRDADGLSRPTKR